MGYKAEQFVKNVDENLICSICHEVFEEPVSCKDGHTFCKDCIHEWLKKKSRCPLDNGLLNKKHLVPVLMAKGIIDNLEVYCHRSTQGKTNEVEVNCDWVGKLQHLKQHRKTCPFQVVKCSHKKCSQTMQRRMLEIHEKICNFRLVNCEKCMSPLLQLEKEKHLRNDCLMALIACPNRCKVDEMQLTEIRRIDLRDHLSNICPKEQVNCPYKEQGCTVMVERQDVDKHVQENMAGHMILIAKDCSLLRRENVELKDELRKLREEFQNQLSNSRTYTWTIRNFPDLSTSHPNGKCIQSPNFWLCGYRWHIILYPNGDSERAAGFLSLFLGKTEDDSPTLTIPDTSSNESTIDFRMTVISQKPDTSDVSHHAKHVFNLDKHSLGWPNFMKADVALLPSYCKDGTFTIQCTIQPDHKPQ